MEGREVTSQEENPLVSAAVRIADALEKLAADPEVEIEVGPPVCPSCGVLNPTVVLPAQEGGQGPMAEIIINCHCAQCGSPIYVVIESFSPHRSSITAKTEIETRKAAGLFVNNQ